jgi:hypothetical protein
LVTNSQGHHCAPLHVVVVNGARDARAVMHRRGVAQPA